MTQRITLIAAIARNGTIGRDNAMPWHLPEDMAFFKATTWGHPVIMGRRTFDSIGRALPGRTNIVVSRNPEWGAVGVRRAGSLDEAFALCATEPESFVIGGATLYQDALRRADRLLLTELKADFPGDVRFPDIPADFVEVARTPHRDPVDPGLEFDFVTYERR